MSRWKDTGELANKALNYEVRGGAATFAVELKDRIADELPPDFALDEAKRARLTLALRFINDAIIDPTMSGEIDPGLCAFVFTVAELMDLKPAEEVTTPEFQSDVDITPESVRQHVGSDEWLGGGQASPL